MDTNDNLVLPTNLSSYLCLDKEYSIILCLHCHNALLPSALEYHLRQKMFLSKDLVKSAKEFGKQLPPYTTSDLPLRSDNSSPLPNWPIYDGYHCRTCNYRTRLRKKMVDHTTKDHNMKGESTEKRLYQVRLQSWFSDNRAKYWVVKTDNEGLDENKDKEKDIEQDAMKAKLLKKEKERLVKVEEQRMILKIGGRPDEKDYWLMRTGWQQLFVGRNLQKIATARRVPDDNELFLIWTCQIFDKIVLRAMQTVEDTPREILRWVMSVKKEEIHPRPFSILEGEGTLDGYTGFWRSFLCFCLRTQKALLERDDSYGIQFTLEQGGLLNRICWRIKNQELPTLLNSKHSIMAQFTGKRQSPIVSTSNEEADTLDGLESDIMQFCMEVLQHRFKTGVVFENPLLFFTAVLGINEQTLTFRPPQDYTRYLAGIIWINKLLLLEYALPSKPWLHLHLPAREDYPDFGKRLAEVRSAYLVDGSYSPQSEILSLLAYGQFVTKQTGGRTVLSWSTNRQTVSLYGNPIAMEQYRQFPIVLIARAKQLLYNVLIFQKQPSIDLSRIQDSMTYGIAGYWYGSLAANRLDIGMEYVLDAAMECPRQKQLFEIVLREGNQELKWDNIRRNRYLRDALSFKELLLLLMHITGGQPARGPEIGGVKIRNTATTARNIFVLDGTVLFTTEYDKKRDIRLTTRYIVRYLPDSVGQLLVIYQIYLLPFLEFVSNSISETTEVNDYLFGSSSTPWTGRKLTTILNRETALHFGVAMGVSKWRQLTIGIAKEHLPEIVQTMERYNNDEMESDEEETIDLLHEQAGHGRRMGLTHYGQNANFLNQLQPELLAELRKLSTHWHQFLGLTPMPSPKRKRAVTTIDQVDFTISKPVPKVQNTENTTNTLNNQVKEAMVHLYGHSASFRSIAQESGIKAVLQNKGSLIVVMGTAEGKSTLFMVPALMKGAGTIIVILPFRALVEDIVKRTREQGIDSVEWTWELTHPHSLVIVSTEMAITDRFMHYAATINDQQLLRYVFLDECHTAFTDVDYREALRSLSRIRDLEVPLILLTATLPPIFEWDLRQAMLIHQATILRFPTYRTTISYRVYQIALGKIVLATLDYCKFIARDMQPTDKGIVYCRSRSKCQSLAEQLNCPCYLSGGDDNQTILNDWQSQTTTHWITATGALGTGVDLGGIIAVVHMDRPYGLIDMVQQSGRGGRNGQISSATVIIDSHSIDMKARNIGNSLNRFRNIDEEWLQKYLISQECRRVVIGDYMDNRKVTCSEIDGTPCDYCIKKPRQYSQSQPSLQTQLPPHRNRLAEREQYRQEIIELLDTYKELCIFCLSQNMSGHQTHNFEHCPYNKELEDDLLGIGYASFQDWRRQLRFPAYTTCYWCGLPQTFCTRQNDQNETDTPQDCKWPDIVLAIIFVGRRNGELLKLINKKFAAQVQTNKQLQQWLEGGELWNEEEKSHIMMVFETVGPRLLLEYNTNC